MRKYLSEDGVSMLFVLSALIVTGFIGGSLIKISGSDQVGQAFYKGSAAARSAAKSGMIAALAEIQTSDPTKRGEMIARLQKWIDTPNCASLAPADRWIVGGPTDADFQDLSDHLKYRAELLAFDTSNFTVTVRADGKQTGGGSATYLGTYRLDGLEFNRQQAEIPTSALYMGGGGDEFDRAMHIYGGTFLRGNAFCFDNLEQQYEFHGQFYLENLVSYSNNNLNSYFQLRNGLFHERAYFDGLFTIERHDDGTGTTGTQTVFKKAMGYETHLWVGQNAGFKVESEGIYANGSMYRNADPNHPTEPYGPIELLNGGQVHYHQNQGYFNMGESGSAISLSTMTDAPTGDIIPHNGINIKSILGIQKPPKLNIDMTAVMAKAKAVHRGYGEVLPNLPTGEDMNDLYENYPENDFFVDSLGEKWMVLKLKSHANSLSFSPLDDPFKYKVIWIIDKTVTFNTAIYNHSNSGDEKGNTLIYVASNGQLDRFKTPETFRGFIFSEATTNQGVIVQARAGTALHGGIYVQDNAGTMRVEGGAEQNADGTFPLDAANQMIFLPGVFTVRFDQSVIDELVPLGIFVPENTSTATTLQLQTNRTNIAANHLSAIM